MRMKTVAPSERIQKLRVEVLELLIKRSAEEEIPPEQVLAILSYTVGQCILQLDQTKYTAAMAMAIVQSNIQNGNQDGLAKFLGTLPAGRA